MEQRIFHGLAYGNSLNRYDLQQVLQGMLVESEHTGSVDGVKKYFNKSLPVDPVTAMDISKDHLEEFPRYYTYLEEMEKKMVRDLKSNNR